MYAIRSYYAILNIYYEIPKSIVNFDCADLEDNKELRKRKINWENKTNSYLDRITSYNVCYTKLLRVYRCFVFVDHVPFFKDHPPAGIKPGIGLGSQVVAVFLKSFHDAVRNGLVFGIFLRKGP